MPDRSSLPVEGEPTAPLMLELKQVKRCHIHLPDTPKPMGAIFYQGQFYSYVKLFPDLTAAQRAAERLILRDNRVILTVTVRGWVLWVQEPEAQLATKSEGTKS